MLPLPLPLLAALGQLALAAAGPVWLVGSTTQDSFPPTGTTVDAALFPDRTAVGYPGAERLGAQPYMYQTAPPSAPFPKVQDPFGPVFLPKAQGKSSSGFQPIMSWGFYSPRYSLPPDTFGAGNASPVVPEQCELTDVHLLFRHGARYPTTGEISAAFAQRLGAAARNGTFNGTGELSFLNNWTYKLGSDILVPFGRQQCYELGVRSRMAYGHLLDDFVQQGALPVFRTGSIDRMVESMEAFGQGFFGRDSHKQFSMTIAIESSGINATVYPGGGTCPNSAQDSAAAGLAQTQFINRAFAGTAQRFTAANHGTYTFTPADVLAMASLCAYESLALGYSKFCPLFTEQDFANMQYAFDLVFYYGNGFGAQTGAAQGKGWVQEFLARLTNTPLAVYDSSTNSTLDGNNKTFPLNQSIYADASHDSYILSTLVALNFTAINTYGRLPTDVPSGPKERAFVSSYLVPFNTNLVAQVMTCEGVSAPQMRFILNDAAIPLAGTYAGCEHDNDGLCDVAQVVAALDARMAEIDYTKACTGPIFRVTDPAQLRDSNGLPY